MKVLNYLYFKTRLYMKKIITEAYKKRNSNDKATRYIEVYAKRLTPEQTDPQKPSTEQVQITFRNLDPMDAKQISETIIPNAYVYKYDKVTAKGTYKLTGMKFSVPDVKIAKWLRMVLPKIQTVFENSNNEQSNSIDKALSKKEALD